MACGAEKRTAGIGLAGLIGNIGKTVWAGKSALTLASPFALLGALLRLIAAYENMEQCAEAEGKNVDQLREQRQKLQQEVDELHRQLEQQQQQQQSGHP